VSNEIKRQVYLEKSKRGYFGYLDFEMRLRRMCNHGTFEQQGPEAEVLQNFNGSNAMGSTICDSWKKELSGTILVDSLCNGHYTICGHLLAPNAFLNAKKLLQQSKRPKIEFACFVNRSCLETILSLAQLRLCLVSSVANYKSAFYLSSLMGVLPR